MAKSGNNKKRKAARPKLPTKVSYDYIKTGSHRVILVHGAHGGLTPNGKHLSMTVYSERLPIPTKETFAITREGKLGDLTERASRSAIIRECDVTLMLDVDSASALRDWLSERIKKMKELTRK